MNDINENDTLKETPAGAPVGADDHIPVSTFEVVPYGETKNEKELYSFREAIEQPPPAEPVAAKKQVQPPPVAKALIAVGLLGLAAIVGFALYSFAERKANVSYMDMGSERFDPAGLSGHLIARWDSSGSYQLYLDPIGPDHAKNFADVAADPPRQLSVNIRLLDASGLAVCEKQILFPAPLPPAQDDNNSAPQAQGMRQSDTGDTAANMTGENGQIAEIDVRGPLSCPAKAYEKFKGWDFTADFPTAAEEQDWLHREKSGEAKSHGGRGNPRARTVRMAGPIEGDDVIIADNPSHGTVETSGGRVFFLVTGIRNRTAEWQVFPAAIHFRCDKKGLCSLRRDNSSVALEARLVK